MHHLPSILHLSTSDGNGGAARAAYRIHRALVDSGLNSSMHVVIKTEQDDSVIGANINSPAARLRSFSIGLYENHLRHDWHTDNPVLHSLGLQHIGLKRVLKEEKADIYHLHWVSGLLSITDIGRLRKPVVWTLHDMWAFCGAEHYATEDPVARWRAGYRTDNRPPTERGRDLNRYTWESKYRAWQSPMTLVTPSRWLAQCACDSMLFHDAVVHVIPNPIDMSFWKPIAQPAAREALGLPVDGRLILFGADGGLSDPRKGGRELRAALGYLAGNRFTDVQLVVYGQCSPHAKDPAYEWPGLVHWLGKVSDDEILKYAYNAADVMVIPSLQDNLPNTALEAQACGTPVVAFNIGGLPDIISHQQTGYLARPFDVQDLAKGIEWILTNTGCMSTLRQCSRLFAENRFAPTLVAKMYTDCYSQLITD